MPPLFKGAGRVVRSSARFVERHPMLFAGGAAMAGLRAAHPLRALDASIEDAALGDPDAKGKIIRASINTGLQNMGVPVQFINPSQSLRAEAVAALDEPVDPSIDPYVPFGTTGPAYRRGQNPYPTGYNPDGSVVFGLYNERLK